MAKSARIFTGWLFLMGAGGACDGSGGGAGGSSTDADCDLEGGCGVVGIHLDSGDNCDPLGEPYEVRNGDTGRCALEQLRDGAPGRLVINQSPPSGEGFGYCGLSMEIHILEDRSAIVVARDYVDLTEDVTTWRASLRPAMDYQECLNDGPWSYHVCLAEPVVLLNANPTCPCTYCVD